MFVLNAFTVKGYGEAEYWFAMIKVITVVIFIIVGILVDTGVLGGKKIGGENWRIEGAPFYKGIAGIVTTSIVSGFAFQVNYFYFYFLFKKVFKFKREQKQLV